MRNEYLGKANEHELSLASFGNGTIKLTGGGRKAPARKRTTCLMIPTGSWTVSFDVDSLFMMVTTGSERNNKQPEKVHPRLNLDKPISKKKQTVDKSIVE